MIMYLLSKILPKSSKELYQEWMESFSKASEITTKCKVCSTSDHNFLKSRHGIYLPADFFSPISVYNNWDKTKFVSFCVIDKVVHIHLVGDKSISAILHQSNFVIKKIEKDISNIFKKYMAEDLKNQQYN